MPEYGQQQTTGIKYIKVSKTDKEGNDRGQSLLTANTLRINYPDVGPQNYLINTAQNFADYVLLGVVPNANTSSINEILDQRIRLIPTSTLPQIDRNTWYVFSGSGDFSVSTGNNMGYFDTSTSLLTIPRLSNSPTSITASLNAVATDAGSSILFWLMVPSSSATGLTLADGVASEDKGIFSLGSAAVNSTPSSFSISSSLNSLPENQYYFAFFNIELGSTSNYVDGDVWGIDINQSPFTQSTEETLVTIEPSYDFQFSDYNILNGNIDIPRTSRQFMDVDYSTGVLLPTNITTIISGTANAAPVQDSNYTLQRNIRPRYDGSRSSSPDFNITV